MKYIRNETDIIEQINKEYLSVVNSKQYRLGTNIEKFIEVIKKFDFKKMSGFAKYYLANKKVSKISNVWNESPQFYKGELSLESGIVYTCITNGYDDPIEPLYFPRNLEYRLYTDSIYEQSAWNVIDTASLNVNYSNGMLNRYCKMNPHNLFQESLFHYSIYIDGNIQVVSDVSCLYTAARNSTSGIAMHRHRARDCAYLEAKACILSGKGKKEAIIKQMEKYEKEGFPHNFGLCEASIIVVDFENPKAKKLMNDWWNELLNSGSGRDQIALPYVIWKNGMRIDDIGWLGDDLFANPKFRNVDFGKHKK